MVSREDIKRTSTKGYFIVFLELDATLGDEYRLDVKKKRDFGSYGKKREIRWAGVH